ncbi:MAG: DUF2182 domain-containing protein [Acidobacteriota bacterium]
MPWLLAASAVAFTLVLLLPHHGGLASLVATARHKGVMAALVTLSEPTMVWRTVLDWGLMVIGMMTPLLSMPLAYVRFSCAPEAQTGAGAAFLLAYLGCWWGAAALFVPALLVLASVTLNATTLGLAFALGLTWSASPWAQAARNRCHRTVRIGGLPPQAYRDGARQGLQTVSGCILACWPWMLVPMLSHHGHVILMVVATLYLFAERIAPHSAPSWRTPPALESIFGPDRLVRLSRRVRTGA